MQKRKDRAKIDKLTPSAPTEVWEEVMTEIEEIDQKKEVVNFFEPKPSSVVISAPKKIFSSIITTTAQIQWKKEIPTEFIGQRVKMLIRVSSGKQKRSFYFPYILDEYQPTVNALFLPAVLDISLFTKTSEPIDFQFKVTLEDERVLALSDIQAIFEKPKTSVVINDFRLSREIGATEVSFSVQTKKKSKAQFDVKIISPRGIYTIYEKKIKLKGSKKENLQAPLSISPCFHSSSFWVAATISAKNLRTMIAKRIKPTTREVIRWSLLNKDNLKDGYKFKKKYRCTLQLDFVRALNTPEIELCVTQGSKVRVISRFRINRNIEAKETVKKQKIVWKAPKKGNEEITFFLKVKNEYGELTPNLIAGDFSITAINFK
ncbi:MAG: hypothetical protein ACFFDT_04560 [Candidatus Hodarchaeota archaeon]